MSTRDVALVANPIWALIDAVPNVNTYDGEIVNARREPITPPLDDDGRVHAYAVFYASSGLARAITLDADPDVLDFSFQVTCVGGDRERALWCVTQIRKALTGVWVTVAGQQLQIREDVSGAVRPDNNTTPPRHFAPLQFVLTGA